MASFGCSGISCTGCTMDVSHVSDTKTIYHVYHVRWICHSMLFFAYDYGANILRGNTQFAITGYVGNRLDN